MKEIIYAQIYTCIGTLKEFIESGEEVNHEVHRVFIKNDKRIVEPCIIVNIKESGYESGNYKLRIYSNECGSYGDSLLHESREIYQVESVELERTRAKTPEFKIKQ